jgi:hypothetical protein
MISTTPVPERYTRFSCPHPACAGCNRPSEGNLGPRSWTGTHRPSEGRRCTACDRACSEREGTWRARSTRPEATVHQLLPCQRWGLCEAGTAASCAVALKTVQRWQSVAAHRAQTQQQQVVPQGDVSGVPWDEAQAKLRPRRVAWSQTALAMGRGGLLGGDGGPRPPDTAATLLAQVVARAQALPRWLPDGCCGRSWGASIGRHVGGTWAASPPPDAGPPQTCARRRSCRAATRRAMSWRSRGAWCTAARGLGSSGASGSAGHRARPPVWNGGLGPSEACWPLAGAAPAVKRGVAPATGARLGAWSASPAW